MRAQTLHYIARMLNRRVKELEAENARLRQQRDAANAQISWMMEQDGLIQNTIEVTDDESR